MLPGALRTAFAYSSTDVMVHSPVIAEMQFFAKGPFGVASIALVLAILACAVWRRDRLRLPEVVCLIGAAILLLSLGRFAPIFAIVACPVFAATMPDLSDRLLAKSAVWAALALTLVLGITRVASAFPRADEPLSAWLNRHGPEAPGYPCAAADFVARAVPRETGRVINEFSWGGYLEWRLGERYQTLLDGRTQLFAADFWRALYFDGDAAREQCLTTTRADAAVLPRGNSQFRAALLRCGWTPAYHDERAEVLLPPNTVARTE
jgi:hypothetical protein